CAAVRANAAHRCADERHGRRAGAQSYVVALQQGMQEFGWSVGRNLRVDLRWGGGDADLTRRYAAELAALSPDVMPAAGGPVVSAMQRASRTVPIVFAQS